MLLAALVLITGCWLHWRYGHSWQATSGHAWGSDDAYITYRYVWNSWMGWGPVYNPGRAAVEGYSNAFYLLTLVPLLALAGPDRLYEASVVLNTLALLASVPLLARLADRLMPGQPLRHGLLLLLGSAFPPLWQAAASGLETGPVYTLQLALVTLVLAPPVRHAKGLAAVVAALLIGTRIDGFVLPVTVAVLLALAGRRRLAFAILGGAATVLVMLTLWRLAYYGLPLPNTVYAKVHGELAARLKAATKQALFVLPASGILPWLFLPLCAMARVSRGVMAGARAEFRAPEVCLAGLPLILVSYWFLVGGDVFFERFLLLAYPLGLLLAFRLVRHWSAGAGAVAAAIAALNCVPLAADGRYAYAPKHYDMWIELGRFLGTRHPQAVLAIDAAGKVPYFSRLQTIDMLGLNDRHIASLPNVAFRAVGHNKIDPEYVLAQKPDLIAAWRSSGFDMAWGLDRLHYRAAGYCPRYLIYAGRDIVNEPIRDLADMAPVQWANLPWGWNYMVLDRRDDCPLDRLPS